MSEYEGDQDDVVGYISIKDYAYDESNPLHFGYFEEDEEDQSNLRLANTKSVLLPDEYVVNRKAVAIYPFAPENDNELELKEGDVVYISYKHGQGWLVAENHDRSRTGLVPEEYVSLLDEDEDNEEHESPRPFYLTQMITQSMSRNPDDEWEDMAEEEDTEESRPEGVPEQNSEGGIDKSVAEDSNTARQQTGASTLNSLGKSEDDREKPPAETEVTKLENDIKERLEL